MPPPLILRVPLVLAVAIGTFVIAPGMDTHLDFLVCVAMSIAVDRLTNGPWKDRP